MKGEEMTTAVFLPLGFRVSIWWGTARDEGCPDKDPIRWHLMGQATCVLFIFFPECCPEVLKHFRQASGYCGLSSGEYVRQRCSISDKMWYSSKSHSEWHWGNREGDTEILRTNNWLSVPTLTGYTVKVRLGHWWGVSLPVSTYDFICCHPAVVCGVLPASWRSGLKKKWKLSTYILLLFKSLDLSRD